MKKTVFIITLIIMTIVSIGVMLYAFVLQIQANELMHKSRIENKVLIEEIQSLKKDIEVLRDSLDSKH